MSNFLTISGLQESKTQQGKKNHNELNWTFYLLSK